MEVAPNKCLEVFMEANVFHLLPSLMTVIVSLDCLDFGGHQFFVSYRGKGFLCSCYSNFFFRTGIVGTVLKKLKKNFTILCRFLRKFFDRWSNPVQYGTVLYRTR